MEPKPRLVGITGGIGSGKSVVAKIFHCLGVQIYDADSRAKTIMTTDGILVEQIEKEFGNLSYCGGELNRQFLASEVFENPARLRKLNDLVHPRVAVDFENWVARHRDEKYLVKEAALMIESGSHKNLDTLIVVNAPIEMRISRVLKRDPQRSRSEVMNIIDRQLKEEEKIKLADVVIKNDETILLIPQVLALHQTFLVH